MLNSILAISLGASLGAILRWVLGLVLDSMSVAITMGTLAANLIGGFLIGVAMAFFSAHTELSPQWRLLIITGFLGGLTTFSSFSSELTSMIQEGRLSIALITVMLHVVGSILMTFLGIYTYQLFK
jgi:fluoride exporter